MDNFKYLKSLNLMSSIGSAAHIEVDHNRTRMQSAPSYLNPIKMSLNDVSKVAGADNSTSCHYRKGAYNLLIKRYRACSTIGLSAGLATLNP